MIKLVIFDFDGVLVDSHETINKLFTDLINKDLGLNIREEDFAKNPGMRFEKRMELLAKERNIDITEEQINKVKDKGRYEYYTNLAQYVKLFPGVLRLLDELKYANIKTAIGSNGSRRTIEKMLESLNIKHKFSSIVTFDDVVHGKPAPDIFLKNAENLNLKPKECVVVEDASIGIDAATKAGMKVIAVATTEKVEKLKEADLVIQKIDDLNVEMIKKL